MPNSLNDASPNPRKYAVVGLLFLGVLVAYVDRVNLSVAAVPIAQQFSFSPRLMGILLSAFFWTYALMQIPFGHAVDKYSYKHIYAACFLLWSLAAAGSGWAHSFPEMFGCRLALGIGQAVCAPASLAYIQKAFRAEERGLPNGIYISGVILGPAIGTFVGGALLGRVGWQPFFILAGLGGCVWLLPWLLLAPARLPDALPAALPTETRPEAAGYPWKRLFTYAPTWGITISAFFYSYFWFYCLTWLPSYLVKVHGFSYLKMGTYLAVPLVGMAAVATVAGRAADVLIARGGNSLAVRKGFVSAGCLFGSLVLLLQVVHSPSALLPILVLSVGGLGLASANYWAITQLVAPGAIIGRAIGFQNMICQLGGIAASLLTGFLLGPAYHFTSSLVVAGVTPLITIAAILLLIRER
jgi:MFS family permease